MAAHGSTTVVLAALAGNGCIALAKLTAAAWTGSAAMLSEAIHSIADTANQALLLLGIRRAARPPDERHPFGYGKELDFWAFVVAILLFSLGAGVAIYEGVDKFLHPHATGDPTINYIVLGVAMLFELASTWVAMREFNKQRGAQGALAALRTSKDPALFTVLLENFAAMAGLVVALIGIAAGHLLGWTHADAIASIVIGLILGLVAAFMSIETKALLIGEAVVPEVAVALREIIRREMGKSGPVTAINELRTMHLGPDDVLVAASLDFRDDLTAQGVEATISRLTAGIKGQFPFVRHLFLEVERAPDAKHGANLERGLAALQAAEVRVAAKSAVVAPASRGVAEIPRKSYPPPKSVKGRKKRG